MNNRQIFKKKISMKRMILIFALMIIFNRFVFSQEASPFMIETRLGFEPIGGIYYKDNNGNEITENKKTSFSISSDFLLGETGFFKIGVGMQGSKTRKSLDGDSKDIWFFPIYFTGEFWPWFNAKKAFTKVNIGYDVINNGLYFGLGEGLEIWNFIPLIMTEFGSGEYLHIVLSLKLGYKFHLPIYFNKNKMKSKNGT